jgi:hypothetical protein
MPKVRHRIQEIKGIDPAIESRPIDDTRILSGRNFMWDSKGPKSGFGTRLLANGQVIEQPDGVVQSIEIGGQSFVFTSTKIWVLSDDTLEFVEIYDLTPVYGTAVDPWRKKWTAAYLSKGIYFAHYDFGLFKAGRDGLDWLFIPRTQEDIPGIPYQPIAVAETSGRLVILGRKYLGWSSPSNAERWIPELGGAGQQLLSDRVHGRPVTMEPYQNGVLVWTENDCLIVEFIGGDTVFRYDRMHTRQIPLGAWGIERLPDGSQVIMTKQGLFRTGNASQPVPLTPLFNEFFRRRLSDRNFLQVRLTYILEYDILYVQCRDTTNHYVNTFLLSLTLDRWGSFDERHYGIIRYRNERGAFGYVDNDGVAHRFVDYSRWRERAGGSYVGLDSYVEIGYVKPAELHPEIDSLHEIQEMFVGGIPSRPSWSGLNEIDMGEIVIPNPYTCDPFELTANYLTGAYTVNAESVLAAQAMILFEAAEVFADGLQVWSAGEGRPRIPGQSPTAELFAAALVCGVTIIMDVDVTAGVSGPLFNLTTGAPESLAITLEMTEYGTVALNIPFGDSLEATQAAPTSIVKVGVTLGREDGDSRHYAVVINGETVDTTTTTNELWEDFIPSVLLQIGHIISDDVYLGAGEFIRSVRVISPVSDAQLQTLTA